MLAFFGYCVSGRRPQNVKKTIRNAGIFYGFFVDLGVIFRPGGTPEASRAALNTKVGSHVDFSWILNVSGEALGLLLGSFWYPLGGLGSSWAPEVEPKV
jgi:hypothetical protein